MIAVNCGLTAYHSGLFIRHLRGVVASRYALLGEQLPGDKLMTVIQRSQP